MLQGKKIICAGLLGVLSIALQCVCTLPKAEAGVGDLLGSVILGSFSTDPNSIETDYNAMRNNYIQAIILQHEACQEYLALAEGREYKQELDRVGVIKAYLRDNVIPTQLVTGGVDPKILEQDLEKFSRQKDYLTPKMQSKIQGIADKRRAAHAYSSQANKLLARLTGATLVAAMDQTMAQDEKIVRVSKFIAMAVEAADLMKQSHAYSKQTKKFLEPWEEKVGVEERSKKKLLKQYDLKPDSIDLSEPPVQQQVLQVPQMNNKENEAEENEEA